MGSEQYRDEKMKPKCNIQDIGLPFSGQGSAESLGFFNL